MNDRERTQLLAKQLDRCATCGFKLLHNGTCPPWMCRAQFVSPEHTVKILVSEAKTAPVPIRPTPHLFPEQQLRLISIGPEVCDGTGAITVITDQDVCEQRECTGCRRCLWKRFDVIAELITYARLRNGCAGTSCTQLDRCSGCELSAAFTAFDKAMKR